MSSIVRRTPFDFPLWKEACTPVSPTEFISSLSARRPADTRAFNLPVASTFNIHGGILQFQIDITFATKVCLPSRYEKKGEEEREED